MSSFRVKKSYADKIRHDQNQFTIPGDEINPEPVLVKSTVDGTSIGRKDTYTNGAPPTKVGSMKIRKTPYVYADR